MMNQISTEELLERLAECVAQESIQSQQERKKCTEDRLRIEYKLLSRGLEKWAIDSKVEELLMAEAIA